MTNFDHVVDDGLEEELITNEGKVYGIHSGYSFNGRVYYEVNINPISLKRGVNDIINKC